MLLIKEPEESLLWLFVTNLVMENKLWLRAQLSVEIVVSLYVYKNKKK